ncbi:aldehyde dehydrogenase family protein [Pseudoxanthobacter sp.]|uniref:aldehyde dehydrogenase family protein n=1 Tax=Pseudoxanthobacter sp. TaxID=1925742 RepID=UPI002FDF179D
MASASPVPMASADPALIREALATMAPGPSLQSPAEVLDWLGRRDGVLRASIGGTAEAGGDGALQAVVNPATGQPLVRLAIAGASGAGAAVQAAAEAQAGWAGLSAALRAAHLEGFADAADRSLRRLALLDTLATGRPLRDGLQAAMPALVAGLRYHAALALGAGEGTESGTRPHGVVAVALPLWGAAEWFGRTVAAALAAGNAVVAAVPPAAAPALLMLADIAATAGLPAGTLSVLPGGEETVAALIAEPAVSYLWCAAAPDEARRLSALATARGLTAVFCTGAPAPLIVFEDADLDAAADGIAEAAWGPRGLGLAGCRCLLVQEGISARLVARLHARLGRLVAGDPLDLQTDIGPLPPAASHGAARAALAADIADGALVHPADALAGDTALPPLLVTGIGPGAALLRAPLTAPVAGLITFRTPDEAAMLANAGRFAFVASVWTQSLDLAHDVARRLEAGGVWINMAPSPAPELPLAGRGDSGTAPSGGLAGFASWRKSILPGPAAGVWPAGDAAGAQQAVAAVERAGRAGGWSTAAAAERAGLLTALAGSLEAGLAEMIRLFAAGLRTAPAGALLQHGARCLTLASADPRGIVGLAVSQPVDAGLLAFTVLPFLTAGNRVVLVSPHDGGADVAQLAAALPAGVLTVVRGGPDAAAALAGHPATAAFWHDGSPALAAAVAPEAARLLVPVGILAPGEADALTRSRTVTFPFGV